MANYIHSSTVVHPSAQLGDNNYIGPYCYIGPGVHLGSNNRLEAYCAIGTPAEKHKYLESFGVVKIGNQNVIREFVTIQGGTTGQTIINNNCIMLRGSHLSHDSILEDDVNVSCSVLIGGESLIMRGANLGLGCKTHQRTVIGSYSMVGMGAVVTKQNLIKPGGIYIGMPARFLKPNLIGLQRSGLSRDDLEGENARFDQTLRATALRAG